MIYFVRPTSPARTPERRAHGIFAGRFPESVPGVTVNRLCASGLEAINIARMIESGQGEVYLAGEWSR